MTATLAMTRSSSTVAGAASGTLRRTAPGRSCGICGTPTSASSQLTTGGAYEQRLAGKKQRRHKKSNKTCRRCSGSLRPCVFVGLCTLGLSRVTRGSGPAHAKEGGWGEGQGHLNFCEAQHGEQLPELLAGQRVDALHHLIHQELPASPAHHLLSVSDLSHDGRHTQHEVGGSRHKRSTNTRVLGAENDADHPMYTGIQNGCLQSATCIGS